MNELIFHNFTPTAQKVGGDKMLILDKNDSIESLVENIKSDEIIWFYDETIYHQIFAFEDTESGITIYFFDDDGSVSSYYFGDSHEN